MSEIMAHQQWMHLTHGGFTSVRSKELKAVDEALAKYQKSKSSGDKEALTAALMKWMQSKGAGWKTSQRNKNKGVEILYAQLTGTGGAKLTGREMVALSHVRDESRAIVHDLFFAKSLTWRKGFAQKLGNVKWGVRINVPSAAKNARSVAE